MTYGYVLPSPDQQYRLWTDEAFCIEETDGLGSDEPWFQAYYRAVCAVWDEHCHYDASTADYNYADG